MVFCIYFSYVAQRWSFAQFPFVARLKVDLLLLVLDWSVILFVHMPKGVFVYMHKCTVW